MLSKSKQRQVKLRRAQAEKITKTNTTRAYWNRMIYGSRRGLRKSIHLRQNCML